MSDTLGLAAVDAVGEQPPPPFELALQTAPELTGRKAVDARIGGRQERPTPNQEHKKKGFAAIFIAANPCWMAERTGLEPATPGVTGRYSNQLNYHSW